MLVKEVRAVTDANLVEEFRGGDASAFDELVRRYKDRIYNVLYRYLGNPEDAMDVSQEVFIRAYRGLAAYRGQAQIYTWLYSIAANLARNRLRNLGRKGRNKGLSIETLRGERSEDSVVALSHGVTPRSLAQRGELSEALRGCLDDLPEACRMAFVLRTFDDLSYEAIAQSLGCPRGTVKSRISQARARLQTCLQHRGVL